MIEQSYLFIEESHYQNLNKILSELAQYRFGKIKLVQLRNRTEPIPLNRIEDAIDHNRERKENYEELIDEVRKQFKKQLRGA